MPDHDDIENEQKNLKPSSEGGNSQDPEGQDSLWRRFLGVTSMSRSDIMIILVIVIVVLYSVAYYVFPAIPAYLSGKNIVASEIVVCWPRHNGVSYIDRERFASTNDEEITQTYEFVRLSIYNLMRNEDVGIWNYVNDGVYPVVHILTPTERLTDTSPMMEIRSIETQENQVCDSSRETQSFGIEALKEQYGHS